MIKTNYSEIAPTYNLRYKENYLADIKADLEQIIIKNNYNFLLETGCGTGKWIKFLADKHPKVFGLDYSLDMLRLSINEAPGLKIVNADALYLPYKNNLFDFIFCINAIHHFQDKQLYIKECSRILKQNGMIAVYGVDPSIDSTWYIYDYFDNVYENDIKRFASLETLKTFLSKEHFHNIRIKKVEEVNYRRIGKDVFNDPFLSKNHSSQLANISYKEYQTGLEKIKTKINENAETEFKTSVVFYLISAIK